MRLTAAVVMVFALGITGAPTQDAKTEGTSFKSDVFPVIRKYCLPCHSDDNFNPSELSLDSYELLMQGGKNGVPVVAGKANESLLIRKLGDAPPFGERMPLNKKQVISEGKAKYLTEAQVKLIAKWINEGAKNN